MRQRIKRLIINPIDRASTATAAIAVITAVCIACIPYMLGKRTAPTAHDPIDL